MSEDLASAATEAVGQAPIENQEMIEPIAQPDPMERLFNPQPETEKVEKKTKEVTTTDGQEENTEKVETIEPVTTTEVKPDAQKPDVKEQETTTKEVKEGATIEPSPELEALRKEIQGLKSGITAERQKRQQLEQQKEQETPFDWTNPDDSLKTFEQKIEQKMTDRFVNMSEAQCMQRHDDYIQKRDVLLQMIQSNPQIYHEMLNSPDPAETGYQLASKKMLYDQVGNDPQGYRDKLKAEILAEIEADKVAETTRKKELAAKIPPSSESLGDRTVKKTLPKSPIDRLFSDHPGG